MSDFVRVQDKVTGHKYSVRHPDPERVEVLKDELAVDGEGRALPPEAGSSAPPAKKAAAKRATTKRPTTKSTAAKKAAASKTPTPGAESATTPEEGSA